MSNKSIHTSLAKDIALSAKNELYGLIYQTKWDSCLLRHMVLRALEYNDTLDVLTDEYKGCLNSYLDGNYRGSCNCK